MRIFDSLYKAESKRGEHTAYIIRWIILAFLFAMAIVQILIPEQTIAGRWAMVTVGLAAAYNIFVRWRIKRESDFRLLKYFSVSVDVLLVTFSILTATLFQYSSGAATTAIVLLYPIAILIASFRHDRTLIIYATLFAILCYNVVFWSTLSRVSPALFEAAPLVKPSGQFYKSMYLLAFGLILLQVPITIERLLKSQQAAFDVASQKYAELAERLRSSLEGMDRQSAALAAETQKTLLAIRDIVSLTDESGRRVADQSGSTERVAALVFELDSFAGGLESLVGEQAAAIRQTAAATEEMISNIDSISRHVEQTKAGVGKLQDDSDEGRKKLNEVRVAIEAISERSEGMLDAVRVIASIAGTTNLLAMNAAIEAAHAGDAGRGFSVVADEIRKLAEKTGAQSKEIAGELKSVKSSIDGVVEASRRAGASFDSVLEGVRTVADHMAEIENAMAEQSSGSHQISSTMAMMHDATGKVRDGAEGLRGRAHDLRSAVVSLKEQNAAVVGELEGVSARVVEINKSAGNVAVLVEENATAADGIGAEIRRFKVVEET
jgi:methyl-accepting chemotaxis protein